MQAIETAIVAVTLPKQSDQHTSTVAASEKSLIKSLTELRRVVRRQPHFAAGVVSYWLQRDNKSESAMQTI